MIGYTKVAGTIPLNSVKTKKIRGKFFMLPHQHAVNPIRNESGIDNALLEGESPQPNSSPKPLVKSEHSPMSTAAEENKTQALEKKTICFQSSFCQFKNGFCNEIKRSKP